MALTYEAVGTRYFGDREFSSREFGRRMNSPRGAKTLSELKRRGVVVRTGRGRYRFLGPSERPDLRSAEWARVRSVVLSAPFPKAWSGATAVEVWTGGRYLVGPSPYLRLFDVAILPTDRRSWEGYLRRSGVATDLRKRVGAVVRLWPTAPLVPEVVRGEPVISRRATEEFVRTAPSTYAGAAELFRG